MLRLCWRKSISPSSPIPKSLYAIQFDNLKFKNILKIFLTNWIHLIAIYLGFYLTIVISKIIGGQTTDSWTSVLFASLLTIPLLIFVYGLSLLGQFYLTICVLDILLFSFNTKWTTEKLIIEWIIIVMPFISAAFN